MRTKRIRTAEKGSIDRTESFDEFLVKEGLLAETEDAAIEEIIADQIKVAMHEQHLSKTAMATNLQALNLTLGQLRDVRDALDRRIRRGLQLNDQEIKALPAYLRRPRKMPEGDAIALDTGGTNIRAARIRLGGETPYKLIGDPVSDNQLLNTARKPGQVNDVSLFEKQADLIVKAANNMPDPIKLGYCFSYPAEITPDCDAQLLKWTKEIQIVNVVGGEPVGARLADVLRQKHGKSLQAPPVLNDTVASLLTGACVSPEKTHYIGLIVGTGTNMAGFFPVKRITKLPGDIDRTKWTDDKEMAVNLESGNFTPPYLSEYDDTVDFSMPIGQRGDQRFEKAVSGAYLPRLFWYLAGPEACAKVLFNPYDPETDCGHIIELQDHPVVGEAATAVISRSADLVAAALAGLIKAYQEKEQQVEAKEQQVGIMAEGSLFWEETGGYYERVKETLRLLVADDTKFEILKPPKSDTNKGTPINLTNLVGAACAVLMRNSGET